MPKLVTQAEYSRHRGVSKEAVRLAVKDGRIKLRRGKVDVEEADQSWNENTDPAKPKGPRARTNGHAANGSYLHHRATREEWQAKQAELKYKQESGELVDRAQVEREVFEVHRRVRDRVLLIDARIGPMLTAEARQALRKEIRDACDELSEGGD